MNPTAKLEQILGRKDWERLTGPEVAERARELEAQAQFAQKLMNAMWRQNAPNVAAVLDMNGGVGSPSHHREGDS